MPDERRWAQKSKLFCYLIYRQFAVQEIVDSSLVPFAVLEFLKTVAFLAQPAAQCLGAYRHPRSGFFQSNRVQASLDLSVCLTL